MKKQFTAAYKFCQEKIMDLDKKLKEIKLYENDKKCLQYNKNYIIMFIKNQQMKENLCFVLKILQVI